MNIQITEEDIDAIEKILDYALDEEYEHCKEMLEVDSDGDDNDDDPDNVPDTGHIYYSYRQLDRLLTRIKERK